MLSSDDCLRPFGEPSPVVRNTDIYRVSSTIGCTLEVKVVASGFAPYAAAVDPASGDPLAAGVPPFEFPVSAVPADIQLTSALDQPAAFGSYTITITQRSCP